MSSPDEAQTTAGLRAEFASLRAAFPHWLCWPDRSGYWYAAELGHWFPEGRGMCLFRAGSVADLRDWLRGFEDHARAWQASRRTSGLPAADPPIPDLPLDHPSALDISVLTDLICAGAADLAGSIRAMPGGGPADGCRRHRLLPSSSRTGPGRAHRRYP